MRFTMDFLMDGSFSDEQISFDGIDFGSKWNGWACPAFIKEVADEIVSIMNKCCLELFGEDEHTEFFENANGGYYATFVDGVECERYEPMMINGVVYYDLGAYCWTWVVAE